MTKHVVAIPEYARKLKPLTRSDNNNWYRDDNGQLYTRSVRSDVYLSCDSCARARIATACWVVHSGCTPPYTRCDMGTVLNAVKEPRAQSTAPRLRIKKERTHGDT